MLILTSSNSFVTADFVQHLPKAPEQMRLSFIPTAAEVEPGDKQWLMDDRQALVDVGFIVQDFSLVGKTRVEVQAMLEQSDIVFVAGGNTFFLLQEMRKSGFADLIGMYVDKGLIYGGSSAGSVVAGPNIRIIQGLDDPAAAPELTDYTGLGLTDVLVLPHWGSDYFRVSYQKMLDSVYAKGQKLLLLTDEQYLVVDGGTYSIESM